MCVFVCFSAYDYSLQVNGKKGWLCVIMTMSKSTFLIFRQIVENGVEAFSGKNLIPAWADCGSFMSDFKEKTECSFNTKNRKTYRDHDLPTNPSRLLLFLCPNL